MKYIITLTLLILSFISYSQICEPIVPSFVVDLTNTPSGTYNSPPIQRDGNCCGTTNPDKCVEFIVTLNPNSLGIIFEICDGAIPPGALFYQINCDPPTSVGSLVCLNGAGPHIITFCKPGNNTNEYCITSVSNPPIPTDTICDINLLNTYSVDLIPGATYNWSITPPGVIISGQDTNEVVVDWSALLPGFYDNILTVEIETNNCNVSYNYVDIYVPNANINITPIGPFCINDPCVNLVVNPSGGIFSGNNVFGNVFCPTSSGINQVTYIYELDGCTFTDTIDVEVSLPPITSPITHD